MLIWIRNLVIIFLILTIIYTVLSFNARRRQRAKLISEFKSRKETHPDDEALPTYIETGMNRYHRSYRPSLLLSVYVIPLFLAALLLYLANYT